MFSIKQKYKLYIVVALCFIGRGVLFYFGYNMGALATSTITKIHPVTYIISFLFFSKLMYASRRLLAVNLSVKIYLATIFTLIGYLIISGNANTISFIADALIMPALFYAYARTLTPKAQSMMLEFALFLILANSMMAILERVLSVNFFQIEVSYGPSFRSTALLGHPLNNALITLIFILYVLVADIKTGRKNVYLLILFLAVICFGARGCIVASVLSIVVLYLGPLFFSKRRYFLKVNKSFALSVMGFVAVALIYITLNTSFGERLIAVSFFDSSSDVRVQSINLVDFTALQDFLWAKPQSQIDFMTSEAGVQIIENFVIVWILRFGFVFAVLMLSSLFYFLISCSVMRNKKIMFFITLMFIGAATTNNSLAGNTQAIVIFIITFAFTSRKYKLIF